MERSPRSGRQPYHMDDLKEPSYRPHRGLVDTLILNPGADAPGFMPTSAPRTRTRAFLLNSARGLFLEDLLIDQLFDGDVRIL